MDRTNPLYYYLEDKSEFPIPEVGVSACSIVINFTNKVKVTPVKLTLN